MTRISAPVQFVSVVLANLCWRAAATTGGDLAEALVRAWSLGRHLPIPSPWCLPDITVVSVSLPLLIPPLPGNRENQAVFRRVAQERIDDLQSDLDLTVGKVVALGAFCDSSYPVTRSSFDRLCPPLLLPVSDAGIQALEWVPQVSLASARI